MDGENDKLLSLAVSAPGKVILHGEHAVVFGKTAIAASLGLRSTIVITETPDPNLTLKIHLPSVEIEETFSIKEIIDTLIAPLSKTSWKTPKDVKHEERLKIVENFLNKPPYSNLKNNQINGLKGILYLFSAILSNEHLILNSMHMTLTSDLTVGAGTGSSASYGVVLSGALIRYAQLKSGDKISEFSDEDKVIICDWAFNCERIMHGTPSGIDNATCTHGSVVSFRKGSLPNRLPIKLGLRILLVDTKVSRETRILAAKVASLRERNRSAVDHILQAIEEITHTAIKVLEDLSEQKNSVNCEAQYEHLAELWNMNHCLLAALGVSHPSLERIRAVTGNQFACKLTGAGGGGYAIVLIPSSTEQAAVESLTGRLREKGFSVKETRLGGEGVRMDSCSAI